jgi:hypothetical protein
VDSVIARGLAPIVPWCVLNPIRKEKSSSRE